MDYEALLRDVRSKASQRRAAAFAAVPDRVLGLPLAPLTPARFSILAGSGNAFVCGGAIEPADVRNFVWFLWPKFDPDAPTQSKRHRWWAMACLNSRFVSPFKLRKKSVTAGRNYRQACAECKAVVDEAFADTLPSRNEGNEKPIAATLEAQLVDMFSREYPVWPMPLPVRHTPLKQLFQLARCNDRHYLGEKATYFDRDEARLDRMALDALNNGGRN